MMGAYSTTPLEAANATAESAVSNATQPQVSNPQARKLSTLILRIAGWVIFLGGLVGAGLGLAGLHVEITVAGLILACTAGLVLLKLRAESHSTT
ncbi:MULTISPECIES: hypothetical protein [unclassified Nocardia]|uniref:hypothetical protein n=1 Tax=unclassified Nocardia TaxID=2637762 RepID=UPI001CE3CCF6|nr:MULTISPECIES: hypothetical protein [unclassified Nocardia]